MIIIVEGQNGTGKTTFAKEAANKLGLEYTKTQRVWKGTDGQFIAMGIPDGTELYLGLVKDSLLDDTVQDRFHLSEYVYSRLRPEGRPAMPGIGLVAVEEMIRDKKLKAVVVLVQAPKKFVESAHDNRGEDFVGKKDIPQERQLFEDAFQTSTLPKFRYDPTWSREDKTALWNALEEIQNTEEAKSCE